MFCFFRRKDTHGMLDNELRLGTPESALQGVCVLYHDPLIHLFVLLSHRILRFHAESAVRPSEFQKQTFPKGREETRALERLRRSPRAGCDRRGRWEAAASFSLWHVQQSLRVRQLWDQRVSSGDYYRREKGRNARASGVPARASRRESRGRGAALLWPVLWQGAPVVQVGHLFLASCE